MVRLSQESRGEGGDTSKEMLRAQFTALRGLSSWRRLQLMDDLTRLTQSLAREGLKRRHPELSAEALEQKYRELVLGVELAAKVQSHRRSPSTDNAP